MGLKFGSHLEARLTMISGWNVLFVGMYVWFLVGMDMEVCEKCMFFVGMDMEVCEKCMLFVGVDMKVCDKVHVLRWGGHESV